MIYHIQYLIIFAMIRQYNEKILKKVCLAKVLKFYFDSLIVLESYSNSILYKSSVLYVYSLYTALRYNT
jgi:hypothetical protein